MSKQSFDRRGRRPPAGVLGHFQAVEEPGIRRCRLQEAELEEGKTRERTAKNQRRESRENLEGKSRQTSRARCELTIGPARAVHAQRFAMRRYKGRACRIVDAITPIGQGDHAGPLVTIFRIQVSECVERRAGSIGIEFDHRNSVGAVPANCWGFLIADIHGQRRVL